MPWVFRFPVSNLMQIDAPELRQVLSLLDRVRGEWHAARIFEGACFFLGLALGATLAFVAVEVLFVLPESWRWVMLGVWGAVLLAGFAIFVGKRVVENPSDEDVGLLLEKAHPKLHNEIINAVRFARDTGRQDRAFVRAAIRESGRTASNLSSRGAVSWLGVRKGLIICGALIFVWAVLIVVTSARTFNAFSRMFRPGANLPKVGGIRILQVVPGDAEVFAGDALGIQVELHAGAPKDVAPRVEHFTEGGALHEEQMQPTESGWFACELLDIKSPRTYRVAAGGSRSKYYKIAITQRPLVTKIGVTYIYPKYTGLDDRTVADCAGTLRVLKGSKAILKITANKRLRAARLLFGDEKAEEHEAIDLHLMAGRQQAATPRAQALTITENRSGKIEIEDESGHQNSRPLEIVAEDDEPPTVRITKPGGDRTLAPDESLDLAVRASDDYGVVHAELVEKRSKVGQEPTAQERLVHEWDHFPDRKDVAIYWTWVFDKKIYKNGDIVRYYVKMYDGRDENRDKTGVGASAEFTVRIQDPAVLREERKEKFESWLVEVEKVLRQQKEIRGSIEKLEGKKKDEQEPGAEHH